MPCEPCSTSIHICRARFTKLNCDGEADPTIDGSTVDVAANQNAYVTDSIVSVSISPEISDGEDLEVKTGCDCLCVSYTGPQNLKRFNIDLENCKLEPCLLSLLLGTSEVVQCPIDAAAYTDATGQATYCGTPGDTIGVNYPTYLDCGDECQSGVAAEFWSDSWVDDYQCGSPYRYIHWVFPRVIWTLGDWTLENDFLTVNMSGFTRGNPNWFYGPWPGYNTCGDEVCGPSAQSNPITAANPLGYWQYTDFLPEAACECVPVPCDYQSSSECGE